MNVNAATDFSDLDHVGLLLASAEDAKRRQSAILQLSKILSNILGSKPDLGSLNEMHAIIYSYLNTGIESFAAHALDDEKFACKSGCHYCCWQIVDCTPGEIFLLASHILANQADTIQNYLHQRQHVENFGACLMLNDGKCNVYQHRPLACRANMSIDVQSCLQAFEVKRMGGAKLPQSLEVFRSSLYAAKFVAYRRVGLEVNWMILDIALAAVLKNPESIQNWLETGLLAPLPSEKPEGGFAQLIYSVEKMAIAQ